MYKWIVFCVVLCSTTIRSDNVINIVWMVPYKSHKDNVFPYNASSSVAALALGIESIQEQELLPNHDLNITMIDTDCNSKISIGKLVNVLFKQKIDVVLGPPCPKVVQPIGELLSHRNIPHINWISLGQTVDFLKKDLNTYIRMMSPMSSLGGLMVQFFYQVRWKRFVIISSEGRDYVGAADDIKDSIAKQAGLGYSIVHPYEGVKRNAPTKTIDENFKTIKHEGRIIILVIPRDDLRKYMLRAYELDMTNGEYQFLFVDTKLGDNRILQDINSDQLWKNSDEFDSMARKAFENVLYFVLGHDSLDKDAWKEEAYAAYNRVFENSSDNPKPSEPDEYSSYLHDAILLYAKAMNRSLEANQNGTGMDIFQMTPHIAFKGLSGDIVFGTLCDRFPTFFVSDMGINGKFHKVAIVEYYIRPSGALRRNSTYDIIRWGDNSTSQNDTYPPDTPLCGFYDELCPVITTQHAVTPEEKSSDVVIISVTLGAVSVFCIIFFLLYRRWKNEKELQSMSWKINYNDLDFDFEVPQNTHSSVNRSKTLMRKPRYSVEEDMDTLTRLDSFSSPIPNGVKKGPDIAVPAVKFRKRNEAGSPVTRQVKKGAPRKMRSGVSVVDAPVKPGGQYYTTVASYKEELVTVKMMPKKEINMDRSFLLQMRNLRELQHANLTKFIGICTAPDTICIVREYCTKGSLQDIIENNDIRLDLMFKLSLAADICQGLDYLHKSPIKFHGNLRSANCVIDSRWVCKLTDFGFQKFRSVQDSEELMGEHNYYSKLYWTAPEILRRLLKNESVEFTHPADIYSLGIIFKELLCNSKPYSAEKHLKAKEIITKVAFPENGQGLFRPYIDISTLSSEFRQSNIEFLVHRCWEDLPESRPNMKSVLRMLNKINPFKKTSVIDNILALMEKYTNNLEELVAERTSQVQEEKKKTEALLYSILPRKVAEKLKAGRTVEAEAFDKVTIYFSDIVEFTRLCSESTPLEIVEFLNALYTMFDDIISYYDVYKVETIGDSYMVASGLPERIGKLQVREIAEMALHILHSVITFQIPHRPDRQLKIRIGLHTGPVVAGVVGLIMPRYCLFGDTVNTASRMESTGQPLKIHISPYTKEVLENFPAFVIEERGLIPVKGKGTMHTYWLTGMRTEMGSDQGLHFNRLIDPADARELRRHSEPFNQGKRLQTLYSRRHTLVDFKESKNNCLDTVVESKNGRNIPADTPTVHDNPIFKIIDESERRLSLADSGISMDKGIDDIFNGKPEIHTSNGNVADPSAVNLNHEQIHYEDFHASQLTMPSLYLTKSNGPVALPETHLDNVPFKDPIDIMFTDKYLTDKVHHRIDSHLDNISEHSEYTATEDEAENVNDGHSRKKKQKQKRNIISCTRL